MTHSMSKFDINNMQAFIPFQIFLKELKNYVELHGFMFALLFKHNHLFANRNIVLSIPIQSK